MFSAYRASDIVSTDSCTANATGFYGLFDAEYVLATFKNPHPLAELSFLPPDASPVLLLDPVMVSDLLGNWTELNGHS